MSRIEINETTLDSCINLAHAGRNVVTRKGDPVAIVIGVEGRDLDDLHLGSSDECWELIRQRRQERTISREELESRLGARRSTDGTNSRTAVSEELVKQILETDHSGPDVRRMS